MTTSCTYYDNDQRSEDYWLKHEIACNARQVKYLKFFQQNHCDCFYSYLNSFLWKQEEKVDDFVIYSTSLCGRFCFLYCFAISFDNHGFKWWTSSRNWIWLPCVLSCNFKAHDEWNVKNFLPLILVSITYLH